MPSAEAPTSGRVTSKVARASAPLDFLPSRPRCSFFSSFSSPPSRFSTGIRQSSSTTSAVWEARIPSLVSFLPWREPGRALADDEGGLAAGAQRRVDGGDDDVDVGDAAVGDEDLGPVEDPLVAVAPGGRLQALDVGAGLRLGHRVGAELDLLVVAEALRDPAHDLLGGARGGDAGGGEAGAGDRQRGAGAAPVELFGGDHLHLALGVRGRALDPLEAAEALLARLLDDLPGNALLAVVLGCSRADHLAGERPAFLLVLELLVVKCEIHWVPPGRGLIDWSVSQSSGTLSERPARTRV